MGDVVRASSIDPIPITNFKLSCSDKKSYLNNLGARPLGDTSLVDFITQLRLLKLNITNNEVMNRKVLGVKTILIDGEHCEFSPFISKQVRERYEERVVTKFGSGVIVVSYSFLLQSILRKDPRFVYVNNAATVNAEDGTLVKLF